MGKVTWRTGCDILHFASPGDAAKYRIEIASVLVSDDIRMLLSRIEALEKRLSRPRSGALDLTGGDTTACDTDECSNGIDTMHKLKLPPSQKQKQKQKQKQTQQHAAATPQVSNPEAKVLLVPLNPLVPRASRGCDGEHRGGSRDFSEPGQVKSFVCVTQNECTNDIDFTLHSTLSPTVCRTQDKCSNGIDTMHNTLSPSVCCAQDEISNGMDTMHSTPNESACGTQKECSNGIDTMHMHNTLSPSVCGAQDECYNGIDHDILHSIPSQSADKSQSVCGTQDECSNGIDTKHSTTSVRHIQDECSNGIDTKHNTLSPSVSGAQDECSNGIDTKHSTPVCLECGTQEECSNGIELCRLCVRAGVVRCFAYLRDRPDHGRFQ